jgi:hypothetical protein
MCFLVVERFRILVKICLEFQTEDYLYVSSLYLHNINRKSMNDITINSRDEFLYEI